MDIVTPEKRSAMMRAVSQKNTAPEMLLRKALHARGYRYRLHGTSLPGRPDIVFPGSRVAIFVHGCFWHGHECRAGRRPDTRREYWLPKIEENIRRDARKAQELRDLGWRTLIVWECELRRLDQAVLAVEEFVGRSPSQSVSSS
jgi:DNA mismatch endonuclease (patch repair protein)